MDPETPAPAQSLPSTRQSLLRRLVRRIFYVVASTLLLLLVLMQLMVNTKSFLLFLGVTAAAATLYSLWLKHRGFAPHHLESWAYNDGESVIWRDDGTDIMLVPLWNKPVFLTPSRLHRYRVLVTTQRILVATRELFTGKQRVVYVLYPGKAPATEDTGNTGGSFRTGYQTLVVRPFELTKQPPEGRKRPYVAMKPDRAVLSSFGCAEFRIYTDQYATFRLPEVGPYSGGGHLVSPGSGS